MNLGSYPGLIPINAIFILFSYYVMWSDRRDSLLNYKLVYISQRFELGTFY